MTLVTKVQLGQIIIVPFHPDEIDTKKICLRGIWVNVSKMLVTYFLHSSTVAYPGHIYLIYLILHWTAIE